VVQLTDTGWDALVTTSIGELRREHLVESADDLMSGSDAGAADGASLQAYRIHLRSDEFQFENVIHASQVDREDGWTVFWSGNDVFLRVRDEHIVSIEHLV
jgi:hypothetical protein